MVILTLLILGLKYWGKLLQYLCLPPLANVIKLFIRVIYSRSMVFTKIMMFYNTGWQQYHQMGVNYQGKKFYNIGPRECFNFVWTSIGLTRFGPILTKLILYKHGFAAKVVVTPFVPSECHLASALWKM